MTADVIEFPDLLKLDYAEIPGECRVIPFPKAENPYDVLKRRLHETPITILTLDQAFLDHVIKAQGDPDQVRKALEALFRVPADRLGKGRPKP